MRRFSAFVLHAVAAGIMAWGWFSLLNLAMTEAIRNRKGGHLLFLTNQGLLFAWLYMTVSLFCDVLPSVAVNRFLKKALLMISMPIAFIVSTIYWSLIFFRPDLIISPCVGARISLPIDLALHVSPLVTLLIDFFLFESKFPETYARRTAPVALLVFSVSYALFVEYCASFNGSFPYPFLTYSSFPVRVLIYTTTTGLALGCFTTLNALHAA